MQQKQHYSNTSLFFEFSFYEQEGTWKFVSAMSTPRVGHNCVVVNRLLYAIGGFDGCDRLNTVEVYNPDNDEWTTAEPMKTKRSGAGEFLNSLVFFLLKSL